MTQSGTTKSDARHAHETPSNGPAGFPKPEFPRWKAIRDDVYLQEVSERVETVVPLLAAAVLGGVLYVGTDTGVLRLEGNQLLAAGGPAAGVSRLKALNGALYAFAADGLWRWAGGTWTQLSEEVFSDGCVHLGRVALASGAHLYQLDGELLTKLNERPAGPPFSGFASYSEILFDMARSQPILGVASYAETLYVRHERCVGLLQDGKLIYGDTSDWGHLPAGSGTRDLLALGGDLYVPTNKGLSALKGMSWFTITGKDGLCYEDTTCIAEGFAGDFWVGTSRGAIRCVNGEYHYFGHQRWLPGDRVNAIACGDNTAYVATDRGLGIIRFEPYTLQKKAAWYERWIETWGMRRARFCRMPGVGQTA